MDNIFNEYPYRNFNDLNLDYILRKLTEMNSRLAAYVKQSTITFHDPITWDIADQYTVNTMVVDSDGTAYLSVKAVPSGIDIINTDYWQPIFNYDDNINKLRGTIAYNERNSATATTTHAKGSYLYYNGLLYQAIRDIVNGDAFRVGNNIRLVTLSDSINIAIANEADARDKSAKELNDKIANYSGETRTSTVTGDDTRTAGVITDTADNIVLHGKESVLIDSDGTYTEEIAGNKNITVNGSSTEVYKVNKTDSVQGTHTITRNNISATITGETNITGKKFSIQTSGKTLPIVFPDKTIDLYNPLKNTGNNQIYFLLGDSLCDGYTPDSNVRQGWFYWIKQMLMAGGALSVIGAEDITENNSGSAFSGVKTYVAHLQKTIAMHPEYLDIPISTVIVYSGTNDIINKDSDTYNGILAFSNAVHTYWPNALIKIGFLCSTPGSANVLQTYTAFRKACLDCGCVYIRGTEYAIGFKQDYSSDNVHLTPDGYHLLAKRLFTGVHSDILDFRQTASVDFTIPSTPIILNNLKLYFTATQNGVDVCVTNEWDFGSMLTAEVEVGNYPIAYESPILYPPQINKTYSEPLFLNAALFNLTNLYPTDQEHPKLNLLVSNKVNGGATIAGEVLNLEFYRLYYNEKA